MKMKTLSIMALNADPFMKASAEADHAWRAVKNAEKAWIAASKLRSPEAWKSAIDKIEDMTTRIQVACLVWWDYFSIRPANDPWTQLDEYKSQWKGNKNACFQRVKKALMQIGYPERLAERRAKVEESEETD